MKTICENCGAPIAPTSQECSVCGQQFIQTPLVTQEDIGGDLLQNVQDIAPPDPNAIPPNLRQFDIIRYFLIGCVFIFLGLTVFYYDSDEQFSRWMNRCTIEFQNRINWRNAPQLPLTEKIQLIIVPRGNQFLYEKSQKLIELLPIQENIEEKLLSKEELYSKENLTEHRTKNNETLIIIESRNNLLVASVELKVWLPVTGGEKANISEHFEFSRGRQPLFEFVLGQGAILFMLIFLSDKMKRSKIENYREKQRAEFDKYQEKRTKSIFKLKEDLEEARKLIEDGKIAMAIITVNKVLRAKPNFKEAKELKKLLLLTKNAGSASLSVKGGNLLQSIQLAESSTVLYLRILGTPYAYQVPSNLGLLTIGRQRRKKGQSREQGNDVVIRVPGSEIKSLHISRRHLEIQRINEEYYVIDKSNGHTALNGKKLSMETPVRIHSGDKLFIAGVFILEVVIRAPIEAKKAENIIQFNSEKIEGNLSMEATLGDMLTEFPD